MAYGGRVVHGKGCGPWGWVRRVSLFSSSVSLSHHLISASVFLAVKWGWQSPLEVFLNNMSQSTETSPQKILNVSLMLSKSKTIHCRLRWKKTGLKSKLTKKKDISLWLKPTRKLRERSRLGNQWSEVSPLEQRAGWRRGSWRADGEKRSREQRCRIHVSAHWQKTTFDSVMMLFNHSAVSDSLRPQGPQHTRLPCPSPSPWCKKCLITLGGLFTINLSS